jgi:raffinose/stachyose/melibiose transport system substrate-binding protein
MVAAFSRRSVLGLAAASAGAAVLGACGDDGGADGGSTIDWWHIGNTDPMLGIFGAAAKDYEAQHAGVKIKVTPLENQAFKSKLTTVTQAGNPPSLFNSWGGGVLKQQVQAGLVKDLTEATSAWISAVSQVPLKYYRVDNKQYAVPYDNGMVGFWYNKEHFSRAGIAAPPATWAELLDDVGKLKGAGITPLALAGKEQWPAHFFWAYLALRIGGADVLEEAMAAKNFNTDPLVAAGTQLKRLVDLQPFQLGFLGAAYSATDGQAGVMGNGQAAMELMGQWAPATQAAYSTDTKGQGDRIGFFPFPKVDGGAGKVTDVFGGGNGFAVGKDAPPETMDFVKYLLGVDMQRKGAASNGIVPVTKGAEDAIKDPNQALVAKTVAEATGFQLYLDQAWPPAVGEQVNAGVTDIIAGKARPDQMVKAITEVAKR